LPGGDPAEPPPPPEDPDADESGPAVDAEEELPTTMGIGEDTFVLVVYSFPPGPPGPAVLPGVPPPTKHRSADPPEPDTKRVPLEVNVIIT